MPHNFRPTIPTKSLQIALAGMRIMACAGDGGIQPNGGTAMRNTLTLVALFGLFGTACGADDAKSAFLKPDNWEGLMEYWTIKGDTITGSTPEGLKFNTFLCSKQPYKDFELKFQIRLKEGKGNSGVQIRSRIHDQKHFAVTGPQCDIGEGYWGSLYGENFGGMMKEAPRDEVAKVLKKDDFNDYQIKCAGKHVTIKINGVTTVDQDFDKMPAEGIIAFQLHAGGPMEVTFKGIEFKELK
jgi:3-keto-disaccharide hydrolase